MYLTTSGVRPWLLLPFLIEPRIQIRRLIRSLLEGLLQIRDGILQSI
jgi:hypothetical protein